MARDTPQSATLLKAVQRQQKKSSGLALFWALHSRGGDVDRTGSFRVRLGVMEGLGVPYHLTGRCTFVTVVIGTVL